jgi:hypothetical protein
MNTSETITKLTGAGMQNSYLMTYMSSIKEELAKSGLELNNTVIAQLGALHNPNGTPPDSSAIENNEEVAEILEKLESPEFLEGLKQTYKAKMLEILEVMEIELTPEVITAFKAECPQHLFASAL